MDRNPWESQQEQEYVQGVAPTAPRKSNNAWDIHYRRVLSVWPWMLPAGLLFLAIAWFYLRYQDDVYRVSASIVIQDPSLQNANMYSSKDPINDNIARLKSPTLMKRVVDTMGLSFKSIVKGNIKDRYLYEEVNWKVVNRTSGKDGNLFFEITNKGNSFQWKSGNQTGTGTWNVPFFIGKDEILLQKKIANVSDQFQCFEVDSWGEAFQLISSLNVSSSKISNVVEIGLEDIQRQRAVDIINTLIQIYNYSLLTEKRKSQEQAVKFIGERLEPLSFQLDSIEDVLARFKAEKGIILQGGYLSKVIGFDDQIGSYQLNQSVINSSENYLKNPSTPSGQVSVTGLSDNILQQTVAGLLQLWGEREKLSLTLTDNNPKMQLLDKQIKEARENLFVQLNNYKRVNQISEKFTQDLRNNAASKFSLLPFEEKRLNEILRFQSIKLNQFLDLLKKKEEAGIALASVAVETFIIRPALIPNTPISPARSKILITAFLIGIWLPFVIALIAEFLNNKIVSKNQLQQMLTPPILAELDLVENSQDILHVKRKDRSVFGEQIRSLRASLRYYSKEGKAFHILVTSSMSGEGKSFVSANLAASFALQGKRVALMEFDMRRPKLSKRFGYNQKIGISTFLIGKTSITEGVFRVQEEGHLDLFPTGPIPPNPSELMSSPAMQELKDYLDANYDVVIMDTPPNGIVADAQLLQSWTDITLVLTRFRLTVREQVREIEEWHQSGIFPTMGVILNGVQVRGYYGNKYSYYYTKRKYGYKYYSTDESLKEDS